MGGCGSCQRRCIILSGGSAVLLQLWLCAHLRGESRLRQRGQMKVAANRTRRRLLFHMFMRWKIVRIVVCFWHADFRFRFVTSSTAICRLFVNEAVFFTWDVCDFNFYTYECSFSTESEIALFVRNFQNVNQLFITAIMFMRRYRIISSKLRINLVFAASIPSILTLSVA